MTKTDAEIVALIKRAKAAGHLPSDYRYGRVFRPTMRYQVCAEGRTRMLTLDEFITFLERS
jgi:hypothetical protein